MEPSVDDAAETERAERSTRAYHRLYGVLIFANHWLRDVTPHNGWRSDTMSIENIEHAERIAALLEEAIPDHAERVAAMEAEIWKDNDDA